MSFRIARGRSNLSANSPQKLLFCAREFPGLLHIEPKFGARSEIPPQPHRRLHRYSSTLPDDVGNAGNRYTQGNRERVRGKAERFHEVFPQEFPRVDGDAVLSGSPKYRLSFSDSP